MPGTLPGGGDYSDRGLAEGAMDQDGNLPDGLRFPESLAESGDPVEGNPYPIEHPAHQVWIEATRHAELEVMPHQRRRVVVADPGDRRRVDADVGRREVRRVGQAWRAGCLDGSAPWSEYDALAGGLRERLDRVRLPVLRRRTPPPFPPEMVLADLRRRLAVGSTIGKPKPVIIGFSRKRAPPPRAEASAAPQSRAGQRRRARSPGNTAMTTTSTRPRFARTVGISDNGGQGHHQGGSNAIQRRHPGETAGAIGMTREDWYQSDAAVLPPVLLPFTHVFSRFCSGPSRIRRRSAGPAPRWLAPTRATENRSLPACRRLLGHGGR